jgi:Holliday junction resolvase RusA-like endonuclease
MRIDFFMAMSPPTSTHQMKKVRVVKGKPSFYEPAEVKAARVKLQAHLGKHVPEEKLEGPVRMMTKWLFPVTGKHKDKEYRITKPDTDNLQKMLKDVMTDLGFWKDDCQVCSEITEKFWAEIPGIYIVIESIEEVE